MENQKICCESGRVKVSYKIPQKTYCSNGYRVRFYYTARYTTTLENYDNETDALLAGTTTSGYFYYQGNIGISSIDRVVSPFVIEFYESVSGEPNILIGTNSVIYDLTERDGNPYYIKPKKIDEPLIDFGSQSFFSRLWDRISINIDRVERVDETPPEIDLAQCGSFGNYTGCVYPDRWQSFEVETSKLDLRYLKALFDLDKRSKVLSNFVVFRECVEIGVDVFNPSKINVAKYAENIDWSKVPLDPRDFTEYYKRDDIWFKNILTENIIKQIESPAGCPPPLVKLECCPETGCPEECPPDTCPVQCGDHICCYNKNGKSVKTIYV